MPLSQRIAFAGLILTTLIWGVEFVLVHNAIETLETHTFNALRFAAGAIFVMAFQKVRTGRFLQTYNLKITAFATLLGFLLFIGFYTQTEGMLFTSVTNAGFITGLNVVLVPIFGTLFFKEKVSVMVWVGISTALLGLVLMTGILTSEMNKGDMLVLICAVAFALHINTTGLVSNRFNVFDFAALQMVSVSIFSIISAFIFEDWQSGFSLELLLKTEVYVGILFAGVLGTGFALIVQTWAQKEISAARVGLVFSLEPAAAGFSAWLLLGEQMGFIAFVGASLILAGMIISELPHDFWLTRWVRARIH